VAALGGFFFSIWSLIATYLVHIVEVKERQQWRDVAQTSLDSLFKAGARGVRNGDRCNACFCSAGRFGEAGIAGTGQSLYRSLKSFDRVFEIISPVLRRSRPDRGFAGLDCGGELRHREGEDRLSARSAMLLVAGTSST